MPRQRTKEHYYSDCPLDIWLANKWNKLWKANPISNRGYWV